MKSINTSDDIKSLGTIMGVWAHPDDETYTMGGLMAAAIQNGQMVVCITATRGEAGVQDESRWPARKLAKIRESELKRAFEVLGVDQHHWLDYPDGGCTDIYDEEAVGRICSLIHAYNPDSIFTFGPDGMTGHPDHQTVSRWAGLARDKAGSKAKLYHSIQTRKQYRAMIEADKQHNIFFNTVEPKTCEDGDCDIHFEMSEEIYALKIGALKAMPSQTEAMLTKFGDALKPSLILEAFVEPPDNA